MSILSQDILDGLKSLEQAPEKPIEKTFPAESTDINKVQNITVEAPVAPSRITGRLEEGLMADIVKDPDKNQIEQLAMGLNEIYGNTLAPVVRGINRSLAYVPDTLLNVVLYGVNKGTGLNIAPNQLRRIFNSDDYESQKVLIPYLLNYGIGDEARDPNQGLVSRYAEAAGEGIGAALPIIGLQGKIATATKESIEAAPTVTRRVIDALLRPFRNDPKKAVAVETTLSALAGGGAQAEKDLFGTQTGIGAIAAPIAIGQTIPYTFGKVTGALSWGSKKAFGKIGDAYDNYKVASGKRNPEEGTRGEETSILMEKEFKDALNEQSIANINRAIEIEDSLSSYAPKGKIVLSPAEQMVDPPLLKAQKMLEAKGDAEFVRKNNDRKKDTLIAIQNFIDDKFSGNAFEDSPGFVFDAQKNKYNLLISKLDDADATSTFSLNKIIDADTGAYPSLSGKRVETGQEIRDVIRLGREKAKENMEVLANQFNINKADQLASRDKFFEAKEKLKESILTRDAEGAFSYKGLNRVVKDFIESDKATMSFQDWKTYRDQVTDAIGGALANRNMTDVRALTQLARTLDEIGEAYGRTKTNFESFQNAYNTQYILPFEKSGVIKILGKRYTDYIIPDEQVAEAFLKNTSTAKQFINLFGDNPKQLENMRAVILDQINNVANVKGGFLDPRRINTYLNKNKEVLDELGFYDEFDNTRSLMNNILKRQETLSKRRNTINTNLMYKAIAKANNTNDPDTFLTEALRSPESAKVVKNQIEKQGPEMLEAFRAAVMNKLLRANNVTDDPYSFKKFVVNNERTLRSMFDDSHVDNMYLIADAAERVYLTGGPEAGGTGVGSPDFLAKFLKTFGASVPQTSTRMIAVAEDRLNQKTAAVYFAVRSLAAKNANRADALFKKAMFDPTIARRLVESEGPEPFSLNPKAKGDFNAYLFSIGIGAPGEENLVEPVKIDLPAPFTVPDFTNQDDQSSAAPAIQNINKKPTLDIPDPAPVQMTNVSPDATKTTASELFPFDPTLAAIERRAKEKEGIMSVT